MHSELIVPLFSRDDRVFADPFHWPWMGDTQIFHYVNFLVGKGMSPYRQIFDLNMPGSYLSDFIGTAIFGSSDLGWRLYDYTLLAILTAAFIFIAVEYDWFAGLYAGVLFALMHGSEGPWQTAQRDQVMTVYSGLRFRVYGNTPTATSVFLFLRDLIFTCGNYKAYGHSGGFPIDGPRAATSKVPAS